KSSRVVVVLLLVRSRRRKRSKRRGVERTFDARELLARREGGRRSMCARVRRTVHRAHHVAKARRVVLLGCGVVVGTLQRRRETVDVATCRMLERTAEARAHRSHVVDSAFVERAVCTK